MMREEFSEMIGIDISQEDYEKIEYCYMNLDHLFPSKEYVVGFYRAHGIDGFERLCNDVSRMERREKFLYMQLKTISQIAKGSEKDLREMLGALRYESDPETVKRGLRFIEEHDEEYNFYSPTENVDEYLF